MPLYLVKSRHSAGNCLRALDEQLAQGSWSLEEFVYTCGDGDHAGYAVVDASSRSEAMSILPEFLREEATVWKADKFTPNDIRAFHSKAS